MFLSTRFLRVGDAMAAALTNAELEALGLREKSAKEVKKAAAD